MDQNGQFMSLDTLTSYTCPVDVLYILHLCLFIKYLVYFIRKFPTFTSDVGRVHYPQYLIQYSQDPSPSMAAHYS